MRVFGTKADGRPVQALTLQSSDLKVTVLTLGAILQDLRLAGLPRSLTLGGPDLAGYEGPMGYFGAIVGPVANRIGGARAMIGAQICHFPANEGDTLLHGGVRGTQARIWSIEDAGPDSITLQLVLQDGEDGFPGRREIVATYRVTGSTLTLTLAATTDAPTLMNLANHSYWNLDGAGSIAGHRLSVLADGYLPVDARTLPTGEVRPVEGPFDLRAGRVIDTTEFYDHNFCLADAPRPLTEVASLTGQYGVTLRLSTTEPGLQVYDGRTLATAPFLGHSGTPYGAHAGLALEPQRWPDAPNHPGFPPITLVPGEIWRQETLWSFAQG